MAQMDEIRTLNEARMRAWSHAQEMLDRAVAERRGMTAEEDESYRRAVETMDRLDAQRDSVMSSDAWRDERAELNDEFARAVGTSAAASARSSEETAVREFLAGDRPTLTVDLGKASYLRERYAGGCARPGTV